MNILHLGTYENTGAGRASKRLHQGLLHIGLNSRMLVQNKYSEDHTVLISKAKVKRLIAKIKHPLDNLPFLFYPHRDHTPYSLSLQWVFDNIKSEIVDIAPDIINLHWICSAYIQIENLTKFNKPMVWTLHDMWPFTGGCHYSGECDHYTKSCGDCPKLGSHQQWDLSRWVWKRKAKAWKNLNLTVVTPSRWLADCAKNSSLFHDLPIQVIPNGLDIDLYKPIERKLARNLLNLPQDKQLILFGAMSATRDYRKGFQLLLPALEKLSQIQKDNIELVVFGASKPANPPHLGFKVNYLGRLNDDISMVLAYSAADVFLAPSLEDNLPNTVMESIACGTPCVAFNIGGMPDMIEHQQNGYLAKPFEVDDLTQGISWVLENDERWQKLSENARKTVEEKFTLKYQAEKYLELYQDILNKLV